MNRKDLLGQIIKTQRELVTQLQDLARDLPAALAGEWEPDVYPERRKFGPKTANHHSVGELCQACKMQFAEGDYTTLISLGPGSDAEERARAAAGRPYNAIAVEVHWACATGEVD